MRQCLLTTEDNPYDPFTQFEQWDAFDRQKGYFTCAYLGRIARTSPDLSDVDYNLAVEDAIDDILKFNLNGNYKKVFNEK